MNQIEKKFMKLNIIFNNLFLYVLFFICIFEVRLYTISMPLGSVCVGVFCILLLLLISKYRKVFFNIFCSSYHKKVLMVYVVLLVFSVINGVRYFDFRYARLIIHQIIMIESLLLLYSLFVYYKGSTAIEEYIIDVYIFMAFIQFFSYICPAFLLVTNIFRSPTILFYSKYYDGYRGLAISSSGFFGLATGYALIYILIFNEWKIWKYKNYLVRVLLLIIFSFGAISAARSSIVGLVFGIYLYILKKCLYGKGILHNSLYIEKNDIKTTAFLILILICVVMFFSFAASSDNLSLRTFSNFVMSFTNGFFNGKGLKSSTSGQSLLNGFPKDLSTLQFLIGDGRYAGIDGAENYMHQDSGYFRNIYFGGFLTTIICFIIQITILKPLLVNYKLEKRILGIFFLLLAMIFHIKSEVLGVGIEYQSIIFLINLNITQKKGKYCKGALCLKYQK